MNQQGYYSYNSFNMKNNSGEHTHISFQNWIHLIDVTNSSKYAYREQIYKDSINFTFQWTDFQLRSNFLMGAVVVAPDMFNKALIWLALQQFERILWGKIWS